MKFCPSCAAPVARAHPGRRPPAARRSARDAARSTIAIPSSIAGCVPERDGRILICRRAIEPRRGYWTIPAGFMENGETLQQAAARECHEEALARVEIGSLLRRSCTCCTREQVHVMFRARAGRGPRLRRRRRRASRRCCATSATFRGRTSPSPASSSRCAGISRTAPPGARTPALTARSR